MLLTSLLSLANSVYEVAPVVFPAGLAAMQAVPAVGSALLGNPIVQGIGARLLAALGGKVFGGLMGSPEDEAFKQQLAQLQQMQPDYLNLLRQQAAGQPTAVTRAITGQVEGISRGEQQALATLAGRLGQGGTAVARAQQARALAAKNQALTQLLGQAQMSAQQQIGALTGQATQFQGVLAQQESQDLQALTGFIAAGAFDQEIKDKLQMLVDAVGNIGAGEAANVVGDIAGAPGISPVQPQSPPLGTAAPSLVTREQRPTRQATIPQTQIPITEQQAFEPTVVQRRPGTQPVPGLQNVPRPQAPAVRQQPTPRTKAAQATAIKGVVVADTGGISPKVARKQVTPTTGGQLVPSQQTPISPLADSVSGLVQQLKNNEVTIDMVPFHLQSIALANRIDIDEVYAMWNSLMRETEAKYR